MQSGGVTVSYFGVNQAFQLALAAQELQKLVIFYCSFYDGPGKWGGLLGKLVGSERLLSRRCAGFDSKAAVEIPKPVIREKLRSVAGRGAGANQWTQTALEFDLHVAARLDRYPSRLFVGVETCAAHSFARAKELGWITVLDWPGIGAEFLDRMAQRAAVDLGLPAPPSCDSPDMRARKERELALADHILVCSEFQRRLMRERGVPAEKLTVIPLWADPALWYPPERPTSPDAHPAADCVDPAGSNPRAPVAPQDALAPAAPRTSDTRPPAEVASGHDGPLRVIFAGSISLRKGVPYLLRAIEQCAPACRLTLVGSVDPYLAPLLPAAEARWSSAFRLRRWSPAFRLLRRRAPEPDTLKRELQQPRWSSAFRLRRWSSAFSLFRRRRPEPDTLKRALQLTLKRELQLTLKRALQLTLKRALQPTLKRALQRDGLVTLLPPQTKAALRELYWQHDVLVLPSLGDSFGFVAMEAMACGLPVIVSENCGVPVPDASWRVPVMNADAIAERLRLYARDRALCRAHGRLAARFAAQYTPERYRAQVKQVYLRLLGNTNGAVPAPPRTRAH